MFRLFLLLSFAIASSFSKTVQSNHLNEIFHSFASEERVYEELTYHKVDSKPGDDPDTKRNISELISSKGYPVEEHSVTTSDGYILGVIRIPGGAKDLNRKNNVAVKPAVFMHHGLMSAGSDWVLNFPKQSLGFLLADAGYDVWIGNARGNTYSKRHVTLSPKDRKFWEFSWDEIALLDVPACIDYVLNVTGQEKLHYVGHSMGTTIIFALLSTMTEYNDKVHSIMALAPVTNVTYINSPIRFLAPYAHEVEFLLSLLGVKDFLPNNNFMKFLAQFVCGNKHLQPLCEEAIFTASGVEHNQINETRITMYLEHTPGGTSTRCVVHYAQLINDERFQKFDYGKKMNLKKYGQEIPPEYDVSKVTAPVAMFWSLNDLLADPTDVHLLKMRITNLIDFYQVPYPEFTHLDYIIAIDANKLVYARLLELLKKF